MNSFRGRTSFAAMAAAIVALPLAQPALADGIVLPTGGQVVAGSATIGTSGAQLTVDQSSSRAILDWQSFSIGAGASVAFNNGSGVTLNRVTGGNISQIAGQLSATGSLYLVNPAGVVVDSGGKVLTGGSFIASTRPLDAGAFLAGGSELTFSGSSAGGVENKGSINSGGDVVLIGSMAVNSGSITAGGTAALAAADHIVLQTAGTGQRVTVDMGSGDVTNSGVIAAAAAELRAAGGNVYALAGNNGGVISATGSEDRDGRIWLVAARDVVLGSRLRATNRDGSGGTVQLLGTDISLKSGADIDVSGTKGGIVLVGGDYQGGKGDHRYSGEALRHAATVDMAAGASIDADGDGAGGAVVLWSDDYTAFAGSISARGGAAGGDGGFVETSSHGILDFRGAVDTDALAGETGNLLLDPTNITISTGADAGGTLNTGTGVYTNGGGATSTVNTTTLQTALGSNNVTISTSGAGASTGTITVSNPVTWSSARNLTLQADSDILVSAAISKTGANAGTLTLAAGGNVTVNAALSSSATSGNAIVISAGAGNTLTSNASGTITASNAGAIQLTADQMAIGAAVTAGTSAVGGTIRVAPTTASRSITLGANDDTAKLQFDATEFARFVGASATNNATVLQLTTTGTLESKTAAVSTGANLDLNLLADNITLATNVTATKIINVAPATSSRTLNLGAATDSGTSLDISQTEFQTNLLGTTLRYGAPANAVSGSTVSTTGTATAGSIAVVNTLTKATTVSLLALGSVTDLVSNVSTGALVVTNLRVTSGATSGLGISLGNSSNRLLTNVSLATAGADAYLADTDVLGIGAVDGQNGWNVGTGSIRLDSVENGAFNITQAAAAAGTITANGLAVTQTGLTFTGRVILDNVTNHIGTLAGTSNTSTGSNANIYYNDSGSYQIGKVTVTKDGSGTPTTSLSGIALTGTGRLYLQSSGANGTVTQAATAADSKLDLLELKLSGGGTVNVNQVFTLTNATNVIPRVVTDAFATATYGGIKDVSVTAAGNLAVNVVGSANGIDINPTTGTLTLIAGAGGQGSVTQGTNNFVKAANLVALAQGTGGLISLATVTTNNVSNLSLTTTDSTTAGTILYRDADGFNVGIASVPTGAVNGIKAGSGGANAVTLTAVGAITQNQIIEGGALAVTNSTGAGTTVLEGDNKVTSVQVTSAANASFKDIDGYAVAATNIGANTLKLTNTSGGVTQTGAITGSPLLNLNGGVAYTLTNTGNAIGTISGGSGTALGTLQVTQAAAGSLIVGTVNGVSGLTSSGNITINADLLTISQAITAGTAAGSQIVTLTPTTAARTISVGATTGGQLSLLTSDLANVTAGVLRVQGNGNSAITVGGNIAAANVGALTLTTGTAAISGSSAITASALRLNGSNGVNLTGANAVGKLQANVTTGGLTFNAGSGTTIIDAVDTALSGTSGLNLAANNQAIALTTTGTVTQAGQAVTSNITTAGTTGSLALNGSGGTYALNNSGNDVQQLTANTGTISYVDNNALTIGAGNVVTSGAGGIAITAGAGGTNDLLNIAAGTSINSSNAGNIALVADRMAITGTINAGATTGRLTSITTFTGSRAIDFGGTSGTDAEVGSTLVLDTSELAQITSNIARIGSLTAGQLTVKAPFTSANIAVLSLKGGAGITQDSGATIGANKLAIELGGTGSVNLGSENNDVTELAIKAVGGGNISFRDDNGFKVNTVDGINLSNVAPGTLTLSSNGTVDQGHSLTAGTLVLTGNGGTKTGNFQLTDSGNDIATLSGNGATINLVDSSSGLAISGITTSGNTTLQSVGTITQSGVVGVTGTLNLTGSGTTYNLGTQSNLIGTLTANVGSLDVNNAQALSLGTISASSTAASPITISALGGNLTINGTITAQNSAASAFDRVVLFTNRDVIATANAVIAPGTGSNRYLVFTNNPNRSVTGVGTTSRDDSTGDWAGTDVTLATDASITGATRVYNNATSLSAGARTITAVTPTGNRFVYADQPTLIFKIAPTTTLTYDAASHTPLVNYDTGLITTAAVSNVGRVQNQTADTQGGSFTGTAATSASRTNAGTTTGITASLGTLTSAIGYAFAFDNSTTGTLTITPKTVTIAGVTANDKFYDTTNAATLTGGSVTGTVGVQTLNFSAGTGTFASANVNGNQLSQAVTATGYSLTDGTGVASNYTLSGAQPTVPNATINRRTLTLTAANDSKVYDGTTASTPAGGLGITAFNAGTGAGFAGTEGVMSFIQVFNSKDVATATQTNLTGTGASYTLKGNTTANNYAISTATGTGSITARTLNITAQDKSKTYDNMVGTDPALTFASSGVQTGDTIGGITSGALTREAGQTVGGGTGTNGAYIISQGTLTSNSNYAISFTPGLFTINPAGISLTYVVGNSTYVYGNSPVFGSASFNANTYATLTGVVGGDDVQVNLVNLKVYDQAGNGGGAIALANAVTATSLNVGAYDVKVDSLTLGGANMNNYIVTNVGSTAGVVTVTPRPLSVSLVAPVVSKTYDGLATATVAAANYNLTGFATGQAATITKTAATYDTKNVGTSKAVTVSSLTGGDYNFTAGTASNYTLPTSATGNIGTITAKAITVMGVSSQDKYYDGTNVATLTGTPSVSTGIGGEALNVNAGTATYSQANAANGLAVTATGFTLSDGTGGLASNYSIIQPTVANANILKRLVTLTAVADSKTYDGTTASSINSGLGITAFDSNAGGHGFLAGEGVQSFTQVFNSKDVATATQTNLTDAGAGYTLTGATTAGNYTISTATAAGSITRKTIGVTGITANPKVYDNSTTGNGFTGTPVVSTGVMSETFAVNAGTLTFASKDVGTPVNVTATGFALGTAGGGADASNYTIGQPTGLSANITPRAITLTAGNDTKVYDSFNTSSATSSVTGGSLAPGETYTGATQTFNGVNVVGTTATNITAGTEAFGGSAPLTSNYSITRVAGTGSITARPLSIAGITAQGKTYDGLTATTFTGTPSFAAPGAGTGLVGTQSFTITNGTVAFATAGAGMGKTVNATGFGVTTPVNGAVATNYAVQQPTGLTATVSTASLTIDIANKSKTYGNSDPSFTFTVSGLVNGESTTTALGGDYTQTTANSGGAGAGTSNGTALARAAGETVAGGPYAISNSGASPLAATANYSIGTTNNGALTILARPITISAVTDTKTYDGNTSSAGTPTITSGTLATGESLNALSQTFALKDAGTRALNAATATFAAGSSSNYNITYAPVNGTINTKTLTVSGLTADNKVYNNSTAATFSGTPTVTTGVGAETFAVTAGTGTFADKNANNSIAVTASGFALGTPGGSADANNYTIAQQMGLSADITKRPLTITADNKTKPLTNPTTPDPLLTLSIATGANVGLAPNESQADALTGTPTRVAGENAGMYAINQGSVLPTSNYSIAVFNPGVLTISAGTLLKYSVDDTSNVYGSGSTTGIVTLTSGTVANGDMVSTILKIFDIGNVDVTASLATLGAGTYTVKVDSISSTGTGVYVLDAASTSGTITVTPKQLVASLQNTITKIYDGTTAASNLTASNYALSGFAYSDAATITKTSGTYNTANVGTSKPVTVTGLTTGDYNFTAGAAANYTLPTSATGNIGIITAKALAITGVTTSNKVYDGGTVAALGGTPMVTTGVAGETFSVNSGTGAFADKNVATGIGITASGFSLTSSGGGANASNYSFAQPTLTARDITPAPLTASLISSITKVYDKTTTASNLTSGNYNLAGFVTGEGASVTKTTGAYATKDVGTAKGVTVTGLVSGDFTANAGTLLGNYTLPTTAAGNIGIITARSLTLTGLDAQDRVYDGTTAATLIGTPGFSFDTTGDTLTLGGTGVGTFGNKNVGVNKGVTVTGYTLSGADAGNYSFSQPTGVDATVTAAALTVAAVTDTKVYDATRTSAGVVSISGLKTGDSTSALSQTFDSKNASATNGRVLTVGTFTINDGNGGANYTVATPATALGTITAKAVTIGGVSAQDKVYDGNTVATLTPGTITGGIGGDSLTLTPGTGAFGDKNAGTGKTVTATGFALAGGDAGNYTLTGGQPTGLTASITPKALAASLINTTSKVYDGTTPAALVASNYSVTGFVSGEGATVTQTAGTYNTKNVGTSKPVSATLAGGDFTAGAGTLLANYTLPTAAAGNIGIITPKTVTIAGLTPQDKVFDGTTVATLSGGSIGGTVPGDTLTLTPGTGTFDNRNVGTGKPVTVTGTALGGGDAGNYTFAPPTGLTAAITPKGLAVTPDGATKVYGSSDPTGTFVLIGLATGDTPSVVTGALGRVTGENVSSYNWTLGSLNAGGNYTLTLVPGTGLFVVTPKPVTYAVTDTSFIYGNLASPGTTTLTGILAGDTVSTVLGITNAANQPVTLAVNTGVGGYTATVTSLAGVSASNYALAATGNRPGTITITPATLTVTPQVASKIYGSPDPVLPYTFTGLAGGDPATVLGGALGRVAGENAAPYNYTLGTLNAGPNYVLATASNPALFTITPKTITYSIADTSSIYGTLASVGPISFAGLVGTDTLTAPLITKNVAGQTITLAVNTGAGGYGVTPGALGGVSAANYVLAATGNRNGTLTVNRAPLTINVADATRLFGTPNPTFNYNVSGLVAGDTAAALIGTTPSGAGGNGLSVGSDAGTDSPAGAYAITVSGQLANYAVTVVPGTLSVTQQAAAIAPVTPVAPGTSGGSISATGLNFTGSTATLTSLVANPTQSVSTTTSGAFFDTSSNTATGATGASAAPGAATVAVAGSSGTSASGAPATGDAGGTGIVVDRQDAGNRYAVYIETVPTAPTRQTPELAAIGSTGTEVVASARPDLIATSSFDPPAKEDATGTAASDANENRRRAAAGGGKGGR